MGQILLLAILLVLVYQFDQVVRTVFKLIHKLSRGRFDYVIKDSDQYVGTALTIVTMPLLLYSVLVSDNPFIINLFWLCGIYLAFAIISGGVVYFYTQVRKLKNYEGSMLLFSGLAVLGGLFHPAVGMVPWHSDKDRIVYAKLAFLLSIPALLGAMFKLYYDNYQYELSQVMDVLIVVMIGGVFINIIIYTLEKYFRRNNMGVFSLVRVVAGLGLATAIIVV